ncbi:hypothetical protein RBSWK_02820 [Rhodopirellula baltica SWK14]|uniref:Uncharacterized protein n=1 Tax=Rhodopirellula baltica SWK14 TaxID=993516 RepID=L7CGV8_RHOBT|nr:hypothetical protein RBSWK_02820 [Rhodopirellula baltica SWK14]
MKGNGSGSRIRGLCRLSFSRALRKVRHQSEPGVFEPPLSP